MSSFAKTLKEIWEIAQGYEQICTACALVNRCPLKPKKGTAVKSCAHWAPRVIKGKFVPFTRYIRKKTSQGEPK